MLDTESLARWEDAVKNNQDRYGKKVIKFAEKWAKLSEARRKRGEFLLNILEDTARTAAEKVGIAHVDGMMLAQTVDLLSDIWAHGSVMVIWHQKRRLRLRPDISSNP